MPNGATCDPPDCLEGYGWTGNGISCVDNAWQVAGVCLLSDILLLEDTLEEPITMTADVVSVTVDMVSIAVDGVPANATWANTNLQAITLAIAAALQVSSDLLRVAVVEEWQSNQYPPPLVSLFSLRVILILSEGGLPSSVSVANPNGIIMMVLQLVGPASTMLSSSTPAFVSQDGNSSGDVDSTTQSTGGNASAELDQYALIGRRLDGEYAVGGSGGGLGPEIVNQLQLTGSVLPAGVQGAFTVMPDNPQISTGALVTRAVWIALDYEPCPTTCGDAIQNRTVICTAGVYAQCNANAAPEPSRACGVWTACPFDILCPAGPDPDTGDCMPQTAGLLGGLGFLSCVVCIIVIWRIKRLFRPFDGGVEKLEGVIGKERDGSVRFAIHRPEGSGTRSMSPQSTPRYKSSDDSPDASSGDEENPGSSRRREKIQIIWDIDREQMISKGLVEVIPRGVENESPKGSSPRSEDDGALKNAADGACKDDEAGATFEIGKDDGVADDEQSECSSSDKLRAPQIFIPPFEVDAIVDYYSTSRGVWTRGVIDAVRRVFHETMMEDRCSFDLRILPRGQAMDNVDLKQIRKALIPGDRVEIIKHHGAYAVGEIKQQCISSDAKSPGLSYYVKCKHEKHAHLVRSNNVRRRFKKDDEVLVYQGLTLGWRSAVVEEAPPPPVVKGSGLPVDFHIAKVKVRLLFGRPDDGGDPTMPPGPEPQILDTCIFCLLPGVRSKSSVVNC